MQTLSGFQIKVVISMFWRSEYFLYDSIIWWWKNDASIINESMMIQHEDHKVLIEVDTYIINQISIPIVRKVVLNIQYQTTKYVYIVRNCLSW